MSGRIKYERAFFVASFQFFTTLSSILTVDRLLQSEVELKFLIAVSVGVSLINFFIAFFRELEKEYEKRSILGDKKISQYLDYVLPW